MIVHSFHVETRLPRGRGEVFEFFADAANLGRITPPELHFEIRTPMPLEMRAGALIDYRLRLMGVSFRWVTRIAVWDPPHRFIDEQIEGPYRLWEHEHRFAESGEGTIMRDSVRYALPLQPFGEVAYPLIRLQLRRIFAYRGRKISESL